MRGIATAHRASFTRGFSIGACGPPIVVDGSRRGRFRAGGEQAWYMLTYLLAGLAAGANALSSVLQRMANRQQAPETGPGWRLVLALMRSRVWLGGIAAVTAGFLLQAAALRRGALSIVEPILTLELPLALLLASAVFHGRLPRREWAGVLAIAGGLAGLLYFLSPGSGSAHPLPVYRWAIGITINLAVVAGLVIAARSGGSSRRAALFGIATGATLGLTAALMKAMTGALAGGPAKLFLTWPTYTMVVTGVLGIFLLQSALHAGSLVAAQPGVTAADPLVSILWGTFAFGEGVRGGGYLLLAVASAVVIAIGITELIRSPFLAPTTVQPPAGDPR